MIWIVEYEAASKTEKVAIVTPTISKTEARERITKHFDKLLLTIVSIKEIPEVIL